jgi:cytochrome c556
MKIKIAVAAIGALLAISSLFIGRAVSAPRQDLRDFMRVKLNYSQKALEGLVLEDFTMVHKNAQDLSMLSLEEMWQVLNTPAYLEHSRKFRVAADALAEAAKKQNLDKATAAFNQLTSRCIECHKYVRDTRMAKAGN